MCKGIIYLRVSTEEQAEKGFSIQAQREECIKKAEEMGCTDIKEFLDEGVSGSILERPMLMNALDAMKNFKFDFFISYDSSRLSRNVSHQLILIDSIKKCGTRLVFVRTSYEDTAEGRFQLTIMAAVDEYERARLKIRTELGKRAKAKQRLLTHNPGIYGYYFDKESDKLTINENQAQIVRMMYNWLLQDKIGPAEIAEKLNSMNQPSMRGKNWSRVSVNRMLKNFSYTGTLYIRRYDTKDYKLNKYMKKEEKIRVTERPKDQWIPIEIPSIIDMDTWEKAKLKLDKAKRVYKDNSKEQYLLSGLIRCGVCGGTLFGRSSNNNNGIKNKYYCCINKYNYNKIKQDRCSCKLLKAEDIESYIWRMVKSWVLNEDQITKVLEKGSIANNSSDNQKTIKNLLIQAQNEQQKLITLYQKEIIDEIDFTYRLQEIRKTIDILQKEEKPVPTIINNQIKVKHIVYNIKNYLDNMDTKDKNKLLHIIIKEIVVNQRSIIIKTFIPSYITFSNLE